MATAAPGFEPIPGCPFGLMVTDDSLSSEAYVEQLHRHGMLLFRGLTGVEPEQVVEFLRSRFPEAAPRPQQREGDSAEGVLAYLDRRLVSSMGSIKDEAGGYAIDYVAASEVGAPMLADAGSVWSGELESSLDDWVV